MKISAKCIATLVFGFSTVGSTTFAADMAGPINNLQEAQETGRILLKMADTNNDGQISQKEAIDAANLLVGGFFFRADANGDGILSQEEAKQAREALFAQKPMLRYLIMKPMTGKPADTKNDPAKALGALLDTNNDKQLQATEVRQAVQTAVQGLFATADTNRDGQMSPTEINAAIAGLTRTLIQAEFQNADKDGNGQISQQEFDQAILEPAHVVFKVLDTNNDNQISMEEGKAAEQFLGSQLRSMYIPEPANSPRNLIRSGAKPDQVAPVPTFGIPARTSQTQPATQPNAAPVPVTPPQPR